MMMLFHENDIVATSIATLCFWIPILLDAIIIRLGISIGRLYFRDLALMFQGGVSLALSIYYSLETLARSRYMKLVVSLLVLLNVVALCAVRWYETVSNLQEQIKKNFSGFLFLFIVAGMNVVLLDFVYLIEEIEKYQIIYVFAVGCFRVFSSMWPL